MIGKRIKKARTTARERLGLRLRVTQRMLADAVGISQPSVYQMESGEIEPRSKNIKKIAEYLKVEEDWLLTGKGNIEGEENLYIVDQQERTPQVSTTGAKRYNKTSIIIRKSDEASSKDWSAIVPDISIEEEIKLTIDASINRKKLIDAHLFSADLLILPDENKHAYLLKAYID
ncbi:helix-turn-helix transcriptional regulator [Parendozoicomonas sp. Alg238-R29]|uniref:helix-turn-helix domain-containing protein n=1 Tax=Parendozoicomonas sp. Alg238-R29 TaxID=2993446 RepID=UPI00248E4E50|nr:helix-turn-helix transcriptional regulator [Parendozoicomonas sp. Alg238-R29]